MGRLGTNNRAMGAAQQAAASEWARRAVLLGWAAKGVVYVALAWIVLQMALGSAPQQASATGALQYIAGTAPGKVAMVLLGLGLLAYAVGRVLEVTVLAQPSVEASDKVIGVVLAVVYAGLAVTAFSIVGLAGGRSGGASSQQQGTAYLLGLPGGRWIVGLVGLAVGVLGLYTIYTGVERKFLSTLRTGEMSSMVHTWVVRIGAAAYVAKGAIFLLFAWFLLQAAITYQADQAANGLDDALRRVADAPWGTPLLVAIAVGLLSYGLFCELEARYRRVGVSATGTT